MKEKNNLAKDWLFLMISSIAFLYYLVLQDFMQINLLVVIAWSLLTLALVYRLVVSYWHTKDHSK